MMFGMTFLFLWERVANKHLDYWSVASVMCFLLRSCHTFWIAPLHHALQMPLIANGSKQPNINVIIINLTGWYQVKKFLRTLPILYKVHTVN